ncbi:MAG: leucine-rich repeat protein [Thermoplasmatales archaeon]|nr:leucine-rich repeat protein [Thermoplasmatales archaeon]
MYDSTKITLLTIAVVFAFAAGAFVTGTNEVFADDSGSAGNNITWNYNSTDKVLTITGTGDMYDWHGATIPPWKDHKSDILSVVIDDGVTSIGNYAFHSCGALKSVVMGDDVTTIGNYAFTGCRDLVDFPTGNGVTTIGDWAFCSSGLESVMIPDRVTTIGDCAFYFCTSMTSASLGNGITSTGDWTFWGCMSLDQVSIGSSVTHIGNRAFDECSALKSIEISDSVTTIGDYAFSNSGLESVMIPDSVITIGSNAFSDCGNLVFVYIGESVTHIGNRAFNECAALEFIAIPDSVVTIGEYAFSGCTDLASAIIGSGVTTIGSHAFSGCGNLTIVSIGESVTTIEEGAFFMCALISVTIPDRVTTIGDKAFFRCESLTSITIECVGPSLGSEAFGAYTLPDIATQVFRYDSTLDIGSYSYGRDLTYSTIYRIVYMDGEDVLGKKYLLPGGDTSFDGIPEKDGYELTGWDPVIPAHMPDNDVTVYAQWSLIKYTITFIVEGADGTTPTPVEQYYGTEVILPGVGDLTKRGYTFGGWSETQNGTALESYTVPAENASLYAVWSINRYTISFDVNGADGTTPAPIEQDYATTVTLPGIGSMTMTGYSFKGWSETSGGSVLTLYSVPADDATLYAVWSVNQYTITFVSAGGSAVGAITQDFGTAVTAPDDPTRVGYVFAGWDTAIPETMPAENMTITAVWTASGSESDILMYAGIAAAAVAALVIAAVFIRRR